MGRHLIGDHERMPELIIVPVVIAFFAFIAWFAYRERRRKMSMIAARLRGLGVMDARESWRQVTATWGGRTVKVSVGKAGKNGPEFVDATLSAASPARTIVRVRVWWNIDIPLFVPPRVELANAPNHVVRSDDLMLAQRMFDDQPLAVAIASTIRERHDLLDLTDSRVRVRRTIDRDAGSAFDEAWALATTVVERLGLPPAG